MNGITIVRKPERESGWTIADMKPGEVAIWKGKVIIALKGGSNVELRSYDEYRHTPGEKGIKNKKYYFFCLDDQTVLAIMGSFAIEPCTIKVDVFPGNPDFLTAELRSRYEGIATPPQIFHTDHSIS